MADLPALERIGWDDDVARRWAAAIGDRPLVPGRAVQTDRGEVTVWTAPGEELRTRTTKAARAVVAGDWVGVAVDEARIEAVLDRSSAFVRRSARGARTAQVLAANMDVVGVVAAVDRGVNVRRIERELVLAHQSGATPMVVLTKIDLTADLGAAAAAEVATVAVGVEVLAVSNTTGIGLDRLEARLSPGRTFALLGASGVGKSSLVNSLAGGSVQLIAETRKGDGKGRHTTTAARLLRLTHDRLMLDTPGVRALALWDAHDGLEATFPEIVAAAVGCRFEDCAHRNEPDCAVRALVAAGTLDGDRLDNWLRMHDELADLEADLDAAR